MIEGESYPAEVREIVALAIAAARVEDDSLALGMMRDLLTRLLAHHPDTCRVVVGVMEAVGVPAARKIATEFRSLVPPPDGGPLVGSLMAPSPPSRAAERDGADLLVVTVKDPELRAALAAFGFAGDEMPSPASSGLAYWERITEAGHRVVIVKIGIAGNSNAASFTTSLQSDFATPRLCALVGMAAGRKKKVALGDVVVATEVVEYELERTKGGTWTRGESMARYFDVDDGVWGSVSAVAANRPAWASEVVETVLRARRDGFEFDLPHAWRADFRRTAQIYDGVILAGEKLVEDGRLPRMTSRHNRRSLALEMEGAGFMNACRKAKWRPAVFRGIADFGERRREKNWQFVSTTHAAMALRVAVERGFIRLAP